MNSLFYNDPVEEAKNELKRHQPTLSRQNLPASIVESSTMAAKNANCWLSRDIIPWRLRLCAGIGERSRGIRV